MRQFCTQRVARPWHRLPRGAGGAQGQVGRGPEEFDLEDGIPAHSRGWNWMGFKVPSTPNHSEIVIFEKGAADGTRGLRFSSRATRQRLLERPKHPRRRGRAPLFEGLRTLLEGLRTVLHHHKPKIHFSTLFLLRFARHALAKDTELRRAKFSPTSLSEPRWDKSNLERLESHY